MNKTNNLAELAIKYVNSTHQHIFLTGKAGTGKTTLLKEIIENTSKNTIVAAPTGIAAINAGGVTLHSLLQLPFGVYVPENIPLSDSSIAVNTPQTLFRERRINITKRKMLQELELLIIDEVSMLRADLLDCIDTILRNIRKQRSTPFGGVQLLFIGDLLQLPPVVKGEEQALLANYYNSAYFFEARALLASKLVKVELQTVYRQSEQRFVDLLNRLRNNRLNQQDLNLLNEHYKPSLDEKKLEGYIHLTTHNYKADKINEQRLDNLKGSSTHYDAHIEGDFPENMYPSVMNLALKEGAQVMFIKNDPSGEGRFFNGKIGLIKELNNTSVVVEIDNGEEIEVEPYKWENKRYTLNKTTNDIEEKYLGSFEQLPIKLAWAITIHKSQGLTFQKAILDLSQTFSYGQLYVALSRLSSLEGLILSSPLPDKNPTPDMALQAYTTHVVGEEELSSQLRNYEKDFIANTCFSAFDCNNLLKNVNNHLYGFNKAENLSIKQQYLHWTEELKEEIVTWKEVADKFINQIKFILQAEEYLSQLAERLAKAAAYFSPKLSETTASISVHIKALKEKSKVKAYIKELEELQTMIVEMNKKMVKASLLVHYTFLGEIMNQQHLKESELYQSIFKNANTNVKKPKVPTSSISYDLYKQGKSVSEIAEERGFVTSTIEGHLSQYITSGDIDVTDLLPEAKLKEITECYKKGNQKSSEIKAVLSDSYTYSEIKLALAHILRDDQK